MGDGAGTADPPHAIKVAHVTPMGERGGQEVVLLNLLRSLDRARFSPIVVFLRGGPFVAEVEREGVEVHVIPAGRVRNPVAGARAIASLVRLLRRSRADVVHTWSHKAHLYGGLAATLAGVGSVYHLHIAPSIRLSRDGLVTLAAFMVPAEATIACSQFAAEHFRRVWFSSRKVHVVYNGTDMPTESESCEALRVRLGILRDSPLVVLATRLQRSKGVNILLEAAAEVLQHRQDVHFVIVGGALFGLEMEYSFQLERLSKQLGTQRAVSFVGFQADVGEYFRAADLVVHCPIEPEAFGMVLIEAMSCGRAVIASSSGGPAEIIQDGITGLLVPPGDGHRLADAILTLLSDEDGRKEMGRAAASSVRERFTAERMAREIERIYATMLPATSVGHSH